MIKKLFTFLLIITACWACAGTSTDSSENTDDQSDAGDNDDSGSNADDSTSSDPTNTSTPSSNSTDSTDTGDSATTGTTTGSTTAEPTTTAETTTPVETASSLPCDADQLDSSIYPFETTGTDISGGLPSPYEPSDIVWHPTLEKIFLVSDRGKLSMMDIDGGNVTSWTVSGDLEGVTVADPDSDFVYIGVEYPARILEFNFNTGRVTRSFDISAMGGTSSDGLEALTFVPDDSDPEGGLFFAGNQLDGGIYTFRLSIASSTTATNVTADTTLFPASLVDVAGLDYDHRTGVLYVAYDRADELYAILPDGTFIASWTSLPGNDQEGIAVTPDCALLISEDPSATSDVLYYPAASE